MNVFVVSLLFATNMAIEPPNIASHIEKGVFVATIGFTTTLDINGCSNAAQKNYAALDDKLFICYMLPVYSDWILFKPQITLTSPNLYYPIEIDAFISFQGVALFEFNVPLVSTNVTILISVKGSLLNQEVHTYASTTMDFILNPFSPCGALNNYVEIISTSIKFTNSLSVAGCSTATSTPSNPLELNSDMFICVTIMDSEFETWNLTTPTIFFTGNDLCLIMPLISNQTLTAPGVVVYQLQVPIVYDALKIQITHKALGQTSGIDESTVGIPAWGQTGLLSFERVSKPSYKCLLSTFVILTILF